MVTPLENLTSTSADMTPKSPEQNVERLLHRIENLSARLKANEKTERIQRAVFEIAQTSTTAKDMESFYRSIHNVVSELTSIDAIIIALYHKDEYSLSFPYYEDQFDDEQQDENSPLKFRGKLPVARCEGMLTWRAISSNKVIRINADTNPDFSMYGKDSQDWLGIPLRHNGNPIGVFAIQSYQPGFRYRDEEVDLMIFISQHIAIALQHVNDTESLRRINGELKNSAAQLEQSNARLKDQIEEREEISRRMVELSHQAGKAEIATGVLHNVGNVLNSINVSASLIEETLFSSRTDSLKNAATLLDQQEDLCQFFREDKRAEAFPGYLHSLAEKMDLDRETVVRELSTLKSHIEHVKTVVSMQQANAGFSGLVERVTISQLFEDAELLIASSLTRHQVEIIRNFEPMPDLLLQKQKLLQVIVNILKNAKDSMTSGRAKNRQLKISAYRIPDKRIQIDVSDNGEGIAPENLTKMFSHGFTTKEDGHGFGLHSCANAMKEMGGELSAKSDGVGMGATFTLQLPYLVAEDEN